MRIIESMRHEADVSWRQAEEIFEAIYQGEQIACYDDGGGFMREHRGASVTRFTRPHDGVTAWATEVWTRSGKWTREFPTEKEAMEYYQGELERLGI